MYEVLQKLCLRLRNLSSSKQHKSKTLATRTLWALREAQTDFAQSQ